MFPGNVTCWLWYFADYTFQLNCAARFVEFINRSQAPFIHDFNSRYFSCIYVVEERKPKEDENRHKTFITFCVMERKFIIAGTRKPLLIENVVKMGAKVGGFAAFSSLLWQSSERRKTFQSSRKKTEFSLSSLLI